MAQTVPSAQTRCRPCSKKASMTGGIPHLILHSVTNHLETRIKSPHHIINRHHQWPWVRCLDMIDRAPHALRKSPTMDAVSLPQLNREHRRVMRNGGVVAELSVKLLHGASAHYDLKSTNEKRTHHPSVHHLHRLTSNSRIYLPVIFCHVAYGTSKHLINKTELDHVTALQDAGHYD